MNDYEIQKIRDTAFCSGYNTAVSKYEKQNKELQKENAELKERNRELDTMLTGQSLLSNGLEEQLTNAKELLKQWVELYKPKLEGYPITPIQEQTEQFLSGVEKMTDFNLQIGEEKKVIKHINVFDLSGKHFKVQAKQTVRNYYGIMPNENAWCLYVILYPSHPLFEQAAANTTDYDMDLGDKIYPNWHRGCTYYHKNNDYVKIGCDYQHVGDEEIEHDFSDGINGIVLSDMRNLYEFFSK